MPSVWSFPRITRRAEKVWQRNLVVFFKTWKVNFFPPFIEAFLYLSAIGLGIGTYVGAIDGVPYIDYIAPAILAISVMNSAFFECTYGSYVRMYYQKSFDAMIATPLSIEDVIAGEILWGATRSLISVAIMLPVLVVFRVISLPFSLFAIPLAFLGGLTFRPSDVFYRDHAEHRYAQLPLFFTHYAHDAVFGHLFSSFRPPRDLPVRRPCHLPAHPYCGTYADGNTS